jgi:hypothetical protein
MALERLRIPTQILVGAGILLMAFAVIAVGELSQSCDELYLSRLANNPYMQGTPEWEDYNAEARADYEACKAEEDRRTAN